MVLPARQTVWPGRRSVPAIGAPRRGARGADWSPFPGPRPCVVGEDKPGTPSTPRFRDGMFTRKRLWRACVALGPRGTLGSRCGPSRPWPETCSRCLEKYRRDLVKRLKGLGYEVTLTPQEDAA